MHRRALETTGFKKSCPTFYALWEAFCERREMRRRDARNRLPKHLRAPARWPIALQLFLNAALILTLCTLMLNKDDYLTDAGPAIVLVICLLLLIYTVVEGFRIKTQYRRERGRRWAIFNFWLMLAALICWPAAVAFFLP